VVGSVVGPLAMYGKVSDLQFNQLTYPMNSLGTFSSVPKLRWLGGSKGKSGCELPQSLRPLEVTLQTFQNVQRAVAGAPGILPVSAWRKYTSFKGVLFRAPPRSVRKMSRMAPAVKNRPRKPSDAPIAGISISIRRSFSPFPQFQVCRTITLTAKKHSNWLLYRVSEMWRGEREKLDLRCAPAAGLGLLPVDSKSGWCPKCQWVGTMR
jgi:hypothetical protein